jgi:hypothetical protein
MADTVFKLAQATGSEVVRVTFGEVEDSNDTGAVGVVRENPGAISRRRVREAR